MFNILVIRSMVEFIKCIYELHQMCSLHKAPLKDYFLVNEKTTIFTNYSIFPIFVLFLVFMVMYMIYKFIWDNLKQKYLKKQTPELSYPLKLLAFILSDKKKKKILVSGLL